jgi:hypothetical protein
VAEQTMAALVLWKWATSPKPVVAAAAAVVV